MVIISILYHFSCLTLACCWSWIITPLFLWVRRDAVPAAASERASERSFSRRPACKLPARPNHIEKVAASWVYVWVYYYGIFFLFVSNNKRKKEKKKTKPNFVRGILGICFFALLFLPTSVLSFVGVEGKLRERQLRRSTRCRSVSTITAWSWGQIDTPPPPTHTRRKERPALGPKKSTQGWFGILQKGANCELPPRQGLGWKHFSHLLLHVNDDLSSHCAKSHS